MGRHTDQRDPQQIFHGDGNGSETVQQLIPHIVPLPDVFNTCYALVDIQFLHFIDNILRRDKGIHIQVYRGGKILLHGYALSALHRLVQHLTVQLISHRLHMAVLANPQQIAGSPDLQIPHGYLETAAQIRKFLYGGQPLFGHLLQRLVPLIHQKRVGGPIGAAHPPPQLVQL